MRTFSEIKTILFVFLASLFICSCPIDGGSREYVWPAGTFGIQENAPGAPNPPGLCSFDGAVSTSVSGYTYAGFIDTPNALGAGINWSISATTDGSYEVVWRYGFGGDSSNLRDAVLVVNGVEAATPPLFPYTSAWTTWRETDPVSIDLAAGSNSIRLQAVFKNGLANIDYIKLTGTGLAAGTCVSYFPLYVSSSNPAWGSVSYDPVSSYYLEGTPIELTATAEDGYYFQSWSGDVTGTGNPLTFNISKNTSVTAIFLPNGVGNDPDLVGYAAVQDDSATPYVVTGGSLGSTVDVSTLAELSDYLGRPDPYVVRFNNLVQEDPGVSGDEVINVSSNKTLLGVGSTAHLQGVGLKISGSRNVVVRNVSISEVVAAGDGVGNDAIEINGSKNVWIDHCTLYSDLMHDKDYYDGLLDIKNQAAFITVSWTKFHTHWKASLISSSDTQIGDTAIRVTYHHNWFSDCVSRLPSIRFGKAHIFNNYYEDPSGVNESCVNSRMGAEVRVENNYFTDCKNAIGWFDSPATGYWNASGNIFVNPTGVGQNEATCSYVPPYIYYADAATDVPGIVTDAATGAGAGKL